MVIVLADDKIKSSQIDLTEGGVASGLMRFMWPIILGNLFTQVYNMVDSIIVGRFLGGAALAAVGSSFSITMMIYSFCISVGAGATVVISQCYGAHDKENMDKTANTALVLALLVGIAITIGFGLSARGLLALLNTPSNIYEDAYTYYIIVVIGTVGHLYYQMGSAILRGLGDSAWPLRLLIFCSVFNIFADLLFVVGFNMGVAGAAWATILAQLISGIAVIFRLCGKKYGITVNLRTLRIHGAIAKSILKIGIPAGMQQLVFAAGSSVVQSFTNSFGSDVVAAQSTVIKIDGFIMLPMQAIGTAIQTFVGQNIGANKTERLKEGARLAILFCAVISIGLGIVIMAIAPLGVSLFTSEKEIIRIGTIGLRTLGCFYIFMAANQVLTGIVRGAGASIVPMICAFINIAVRIIVGYLLAIRGIFVYNNEPFRGLWYAMIISNFISIAVMWVYYRGGTWKNARIEQVKNKI